LRIYKKYCNFAVAFLIMLQMKDLQTGYISGVNLARFVGAFFIIVFHNAGHNNLF